MPLPDKPEGESTSGVSVDWGASREPFWSELDTNGKIERMRVIIKALEGRVEYLQRRFDLVSAHEHGADAQLLIPLRVYNEPTQRLGNRMDNEIWF